MGNDKRTRPLGFFDSGVGGLSVLCHAVSQLPNENFIYYGDSANAPYGTSSEEEIKNLSLECGAFLAEKGVKAIVMACNTATSAAVYLMREKYQIPVISIEPAVKPAYAAGNPGKIVVMATPATIAGKRYQSLVDRVGCREQVVDMPCGGLVELLETGKFDDPAIAEYVREKLSPLKGQTIGGLVMGCTHYSFVADVIRREAQRISDGACEIFDGMFGTIRHLGNILKAEGLDSPGPGGKVEVYTSGDPDSKAIYEKIIREKLGRL